MDYRLVVVIFFTAIVHFVATLGYSVRVAGVRARSLAVAYSLWNVVFLVASMANTIQAPFLGRMLDASSMALSRYPQAELVRLSLYQETLQRVAHDIRIIMLGATAGTALGVLVIPTFARLFTKGIIYFEKNRSVPHLLLRLVHPPTVGKIIQNISVPTVATFKRNCRLVLPARFFVLNAIISGIYTTGVLSSLYAGVIYPSLARTTGTLASTVNGLATVMLATIVDPQAAAVTDQALRGERTEADVKAVTVLMAVTRLIGTLLAQLFFLPAAYFVGAIARLI